MHAFSIKKKLMLIIMAASLAALMLFGVGFAVYQFEAFRQMTQSDLETQAEMIADSSTAALFFDDPGSANDLLTILEHDKHIRAAALFQGTNLFAWYPTNAAASAFPAPLKVVHERSEFHWMRDRAIQWQPVDSGTNRLGVFYLASDLDALRAQMQRGVILFGGLLAAILAFTIFLSSRLQRVISRPIFDLTRTVQTVSSEKNFSVRAVKESDDELGELVDGFNQMIGQIQERDGALRHVNRELERRVEARTRELLEAELKFHSVVESANEAIVSADHRGNIISWNRGAQKIFGYKEADVLGKPLLLMVPQRYHDPYQTGLHKFLTSGEASVMGRTMELEGLRADGTEFPAELSLATWRTDEGVFFSGIIRDVTARRQASNDLRQQLSRIHLLNQITYAIADRQDLKSIVSIVLQQLEERLPSDYASAYFINEQKQQFITMLRGPASQPIAERLGIPDAIAVSETPFGPCFGGEMVYAPDTSQLKAPMARRVAAAGFLSAIGVPLIVEQKPFGLLVLMRHERDAFSQGERDFIRGLSAHVALAIHQARLYQDLQMAYNELRESQQAIMQQERLKALGQMASGVAHDINNALSPIVGFSDLIARTEENLSPLARKHLNYIKTAGEDVAHIVERLREFYRPRGSRETLAMLNLNKLVEQAVDMTRPRWRDMPQSRGVMVHLAMDLDARIPDFAGIEAEIREALTNLILNAVDAMPSGGGITVRTRAGEDLAGGGVEAQKQVIVEVADTGIGMDERTRRRCLEPFFSTKGRRGTGLGLPMVYGVMERHEGRIEIESEPGKGTTIRLSFPIRALEGQVGSGAEDEASPGPFRLLCVDDEPAVRELIKEMLERDGHSIVAADGGEAGIAAFRAARKDHHPFDAVITDLGMPYVDGREVAATVKRESSATPVIMLTGWGVFMKNDNATPVHVDGLLSKPPRIRDIRAILRRVITK